MADHINVTLRKGDTRDTPSELYINDQHVMSADYEQYGSGGVMLFEDTVSRLMRQLVREFAPALSYTEDVWAEGEEDDDDE